MWVVDQAVILHLAEKNDIVFPEIAQDGVSNLFSAQRDGLLDNAVFRPIFDAPWTDLKQKLLA